jgi:hypothetical protein
MAKRIIGSFCLVLFALTIAVIVPAASALAQDTRSIVPYQRNQVLIETVDPESKLPRSSFCIGVNSIDVRLSNNSEDRQFVYVVNRDTNGTEQLLYRGWVEPGQQYLSDLMQAQLEVTGPAGTESLRVDVQEYGGISTGPWMTFYVQECGWYPPGGGGGGYGQALIWAQMYPYALPQGGKGTITVQTSVGAQANMTYYFEILNSYDQLWKRIPVSKRPYERYQLTLPVGEDTKPQMLTYTVNLWLESGYGRERQRVATNKFSFQVVTPGSSSTPYQPGYPGGTGYPGYPGYYPNYPGYSGSYPSGYGWPPTTTWDPYSGGMPYSSSPYTMPTYGVSPYGTQYSVGGTTERSID